MNEPNNTLLEDCKPAGRRYTTVKELMRGEGVPEAIQNQVAELAKARKVAIHLARMRTRAGLTQSDMAKRLGITQSAVSKLEAGTDAEITLKELQQYSLACKERISMMFGKRVNHVEAVKIHALSIRSHLEELAKIANHDESLEKEISSFFGEAFFNILTILSSCNEKLPTSNSDFEVRIEPVRAVTSTRAQRMEERELAAV